VSAELCQIVDEWIEIIESKGKLLTPPTVLRRLAAKVLAEVNGVI
jgi:hypothetical protein